jgi:hypothetical protein
MKFRSLNLLEPSGRHRAGPVTGLLYLLLWLCRNRVIGPAALLQLPVCTVHRAVWQEDLLELSVSFDAPISWGFQWFFWRDNIFGFSGILGVPLWKGDVTGRVLLEYSVTSLRDISIVGGSRDALLSDGTICTVWVERPGTALRHIYRW